MFAFPKENGYLIGETKDLRQLRDPCWTISGQLFSAVITSNTLT